MCPLFYSLKTIATLVRHTLFLKRKKSYYFLAGTHFKSYFPLLLWYIPMENLYILERNENKLKESFDILRQGRKSTFKKFPRHISLSSTLGSCSYCRCKALFFSTDHMLEDLCVKVLFRGLKFRPSLSRGSVSQFLFFDYFFCCNDHLYFKFMKFTSFNSVT